MKARSFVLFVFVVAFALLTTLMPSGTQPAAAQRTTYPPPRPPHHPPPPPPPASTTRTVGRDSDGSIPPSAFPQTGTNASRSRPRSGLGQPGLSFRYVQTFGVTGEPYPQDANHLNYPTGLFVDNNNNVYVVEDCGNRMLRYDSAGANTLAVKTAGVCGFWGYCGLVDVATDGSGNTWVADYGHSRIIQYDSSGTLLQTFPTDGAQGTDNTHFRNVGGIAFDGIGRMFVSDTSNHRIQVYTFSGGVPVYSATIGVTGVSGNDNSHFNMPGHLAVDSSNRLYVVDSANLRIQRCSFSGTWTCSLFARVSNGIAVDGSNNVYVLASGTVGKCDPSGNCVLLINAGTTLSDVAVDSAGNIYVSEYTNRTLKFHIRRTQPS